MALGANVLEIVTSPGTPGSGSPSLLIEAIVAEARADADRVAAFLKRFESDFPVDFSRGVSKELAIFLACFLRLAHLESVGIWIHLDAGLPSASLALEDALRSVKESGRIPWADELWNSVWRLFIQEFAWHSRDQLGATFALGHLDEDAAIDALALLLMERRRAMGRTGT